MSKNRCLLAADMLMLFTLSNNRVALLFVPILCLGVGISVAANKHAINTNIFFYSLN